MTGEQESRYAALCLPGRPDRREIRRAVAGVLGPETDWGAVEVEVFPGRETTLLLVHPAAGVYIREDAVRFLLVRRRDRLSGLLTDVV